MKLDNTTSQIYIVAANEALMKSHEYILPEHFLYAALLFAEGKDIIQNSGGNTQKILSDLNTFLETCVPIKENRPIQSQGFLYMLEVAAEHADSAGKENISLGDLFAAVFKLKNSHALYFITKNGTDRLSLLKYISHGSKKTIADSGANEKQKEESKEDFLSKYAVNLTDMAREGKLDPLVGREDIIKRTVQVLCRRLKNNPIHIGDSGVGKTAVVEGLAQRIVNRDVSAVLHGANIYFIDMGSVVAGTKYRGDFEERLIRIMEEISEKEKPIVYLDEIHTIVGTGAVSGGGMDATGILKSYFAKGEIRFIGSTTFEEYKKYFEKDRALSRRFQKIDIPEPNMDENIKILSGIKNRYESFHNVKYTDEIIEYICVLAQKHMRDRAMPDKAIDIMDETGSYHKMKAEDRSKAYVITTDDIERCVSEMAGIPRESVSIKESDRLKVLEESLQKEIYGQDEAIRTVVDAIKLSRSGLMEGERPIANLLFVGPTGVGKTELAKQLSSVLNISLIRYDMSEYQEKHSVARLIGSPPGYVGYEEGGLLTDSIRKTSHCVLLLDEIEKAHSDILNVLLQIMDYGFLTDNTGKKADFRNVIIIMTSNAGAREIGKRIIGFDSKVVSKDAIDKEVERIFSPEFRNRLDSVVVFNHLNETMAVMVAKKSMNTLEKLLNKKQISLTVEDEVIKYIADKGLSFEYGAREIVRTVNIEVKKLLVDMVLFQNLSGKSIRLYFDGEIKVKEEEGCTE